MKLSKHRFHLVFSFVMAAVMVFSITFIITAVNIGFGEQFLSRWSRALLVAYCVAVPLLYFVAPLVRRFVARFVNLP
jgi:hypothetical protein